MADRRCRLLVLTRNFPPLRGGMERLVHRLVLELAGEFELVLVGPQGCQEALPTEVAAIGVPLRPLGRFLIQALGAGLASTWRRRPEIVLCGSGLMAPLGWLIARLAGARLVCMLHGLDIVVPHPVYRALFLPAIRHCDRLVVNSMQTAGLARAAGVDAGRIALLHPGVALPPAIDPAALAAFRAQHGLEGRPVILSVGRITRRKGLVEFLALGLPAILARHPQAVLLIVGGEATQALGKASVSPLPALLEGIAHQRLEGRVRLLGEVDDGALALALAAADVHAFPVIALPGDVEGFGMVAIEAAAAGVATVAFAVGGVPDAVSNGVSGTLVPPGDYAAFADAVCAALERRDSGISAASCREFAAGFSWASRGDALRQILCAETRQGGATP